MTLTFEISIAILTVAGLWVGLACYLFYTKSEVDKKFGEVIGLVHQNELELQESNSKVKDDIYDKLNENKQALEDGMKQFIQLLSDIKEADKDMSLQFITMINTVKEELKNDYTSRYNDLLVLINTKANEADFNRLENKFDKMSATMVELKTVVQMKLEDRA